MPMTLEQEVAHLRVVCAERRDALIMRNAEWVRLFNFIRGPTPEEAYCLTNAMKKAKGAQGVKDCIAALWRVMAEEKVRQACQK